jgi:Single-stranded DNA-binding replication protein A (RPA), large (70 kD) subunit and related ssDNA-binding proteins
MTDMNEIKLTEFEIESENNHGLKNSEENIAERAASIKALLAENGAEADELEIKKSLEELVQKYNVPIQEAQRSVTNSLLKKHNISKSKIFSGKGSAETKTVAEIAASAGKTDTWANLTGKVIQLWENHHESITQVGLVGDETGVIKFTLWNNTGLEPLELNQAYEFKNVVVKYWNGKAGIELNKAADIKLSEKEVSVHKPADFENAERVNGLRKVAEINKSNLWTDLKVQVVQLFENTHESIECAGILGDETGTMRFTVWKSAEIEELNLKVGKSYLLTGAIAKEWNGNYVVEVNRTGKIEEIQEQIEAKPAVFEIIGCAVDIQAGSGLIRRCPDCGKVLSKGNCAEHGKVKGEYDLRIKAVFDDGKQAYEAIINCGLTEKLLNIQLEEAILMAAEELDSECVNDLIRKEFIGKYYTVKGFKTDRYIISDSVDLLMKNDAGKMSDLKEIIKTELDQHFDSVLKTLKEAEPVNETEVL